MLALNLTGWSVTGVMAAAPVIGTVTAAGVFKVDNSGVRGNATLFEGSLVETAGARSRHRSSKRDPGLAGTLFERPVFRRSHDP